MYGRNAVGHVLGKPQLHSQLLRGNHGKLVTVMYMWVCGVWMRHVYRIIQTGCKLLFLKTIISEMYTCTNMLINPCQGYYTQKSSRFIHETNLLWPCQWSWHWAQECPDSSCLLSPTFRSPAQKECIKLRKKKQSQLKRPIYHKLIQITPVHSYLERLTATLYAASM